MKTCSYCNQVRQLVDFQPDSRRRGGHTNKCRECRKVYDREYRARNRERISVYHQAWRDKNRERVRATGHEKHVARTYGISTGEYARLLAEQGGVCALCHQPEQRRGRSGALCRLCVDHCHETGRVRGLLCGVCNTALERIDTDPTWADRALTYRRTA